MTADGPDRASDIESGNDAASSLRAVRDAWVTAIRDGDADAWVSLLADDVVWVPSRGPALEGRDAVRAWLARVFTTYDFGYEVRDIRLTIRGDRAAEVSAFVSSVASPGADPREHRGVYTLLWVRTPAGWRIERYVDHTGLERERDER